MPAVSPSPQHAPPSEARQAGARPPAHEMTRASKQLKKEAERSERAETRGAGSKPSSARESGKSGPPAPPVAGREVVGCEISVWSASRAAWKKATIEDHDPAQARHLVRFRERDSGGAEESWLDLGRTRFQWAPRARIPANPTAARAPPDATLVGSRVKIFWPGMARWYLGRVERWDPKTRRHTVRYRDGDVRDLALKYEAVQYLGPERKDCDEGGKKERGDRDAGRTPTPTKKLKPSGGADRAIAPALVKKASPADEGGKPSASKPSAARRRPSEPSRLGKPVSKSAKRLHSPGEAQVAAAKKARRGAGTASEESGDEESSSESSSSGDEFEAPSRGTKRPPAAKGGKASKAPAKSARKELKTRSPSDEPGSRSASPARGALEAEAAAGAGGAAPAAAAATGTATDAAPASTAAAAQAAAPPAAGASPRAPTPSAGLDVLGCRVSVECGSAAVRGRVVQFDSYHKRHKVVFDTGEEDWLSLSRERFLWLLPRAGREPAVLRAVAQAMAAYGAEELGAGAPRMLGGPGSNLARSSGGSGAHLARPLGVPGPGRSAGKPLKKAKTTGALGRSSGPKARLGTSKSLPAPAGKDSQPGTPQSGGNPGLSRAQGGVTKPKPTPARPALPSAAFCLERRRCLGSLLPEDRAGDAPAPELDAACVGRRLALRCAGSGAWHAGVVVAWRAAEEGAEGEEQEVGKGKDREREKDRDRTTRPSVSPSPAAPLFLVLYDDGEDEWVSLGALSKDALRWKGSAALPLQLSAWSEVRPAKVGESAASTPSASLPCGAGAVGWRLAALLPEQQAFVAGVVEAYEPDAQAYVLAEESAAAAPASPRTPRSPAPVRALAAAHTLKWMHPPRASALDRVTLAPARAPAAPSAPSAATLGTARGSKFRAEEASRSKGAKGAPPGEDLHAERPAQGLAASARAACAGELGRLLRAPSRWAFGFRVAARGGDPESEPGSPPPHAAAACAAPPLCIRASFLDRAGGRASMVRVYCSGAGRDGAALPLPLAAAPSFLAAQAASPFEASRAPPAAREKSGRTGPDAAAVRIMLRCVRLARSRLLDLEPARGALLDRGAGGSKALHAPRGHHHHRLARGAGQEGEVLTPRLGNGGKGLDHHSTALDHRSKALDHRSKGLDHRSKALDNYSAVPSSGDERDPGVGRGLAVKPSWQAWASADRGSTPGLSADASPADAPAPDAAATPREQPQPSSMQRGMSLGLEEGVLRVGQEEEESLVELSLVGEGLAL